MSLYMINRSDVRVRSLRDSMLHRVRRVRATLGPTFARQAVMFRLVLMVFANFVSMRMEMSLQLASRCITATGGEIWVSRASAYTFVVLTVSFRYLHRVYSVQFCRGVHFDVGTVQGKEPPEGHNGEEGLEEIEEPRLTFDWLGL